MLGALLGILAVIATGCVGLAAAVWAAWRSKVKPMLADTRHAAEKAAEQLAPNHGSSARDALARIEAVVDRLDRGMSRQLGEIRADLSHHIVNSDRLHHDVGRRLNRLETPEENTR